MEKISGDSRDMKYVMKIFISAGVKNREEISIFWFDEEERIVSFGQNIYPCNFNKINKKNRR